jgi:membrane protease YdiL (CAAX protease family)
MELSTGFLRGEGGRLRLAWRLLLYVTFFFVILIGALFIAPDGVAGQALPILLAGLGAGWLSLAMDGRRAGSLGFYLSPSLGIESVKGLALGVVVALVAVGCMAAAGGVTWTRESGTAGSLLVVGAQALWLFAVPAAAEEVLFRGYLLQALTEAWGAILALLVMALAFAAVHLGNPHVSWIGVVNIAAAGVFLGAVYLKTGSLWWATGAHLGWNWGHAFITDLPVSGLDLVDTPLYDVTTVGPTWVSGGGFGPEGSLLSTVVLLAATVWLWNSRGLSPEPTAVRARPLIWSDEPHGPEGWTDVPAIAVVHEPTGRR